MMLETEYRWAESQGSEMITNIHIGNSRNDNGPCYASVLA